MLDEEGGDEFLPDWTSPPGDTIRDLMDAMLLSIPQLAAQLDLVEAHARDLLEGRAPVTPQIADKLAQLFGPSATFWRRRELHYRADLVRLGYADLADALARDERQQNT